MTEIFRMPAAAGDGVELVRYQDVIFPNNGIVDAVWGVNYCKNFKYKPGDILMCTIPKCGTNWLGHMIWKLKTLDESERPGDALLEFGQPEILENMESPRIIYTHMKPNRLPVEHLKNRGKIVLMVRNPKDAMVSLHHHMKNAALIKSKQTFDELFQSYITGQVPFGSHFDYVQQWEQFLKEKSDGQQVEVFYYEDFKANCKENLTRLNKFLGFDRDEKYIERVMEETSISALREQEANTKREQWPMAKDEQGNSVIYRKGEVGDWKIHMTVAQSEIVDKLMEERLKHGFLNFTYEL